MNEPPGDSHRAPGRLPGHHHLLREPVPRHVQPHEVDAARHPPALVVGPVPAPAVDARATLLPLERLHLAVRQRKMPSLLTCLGEGISKVPLFPALSLARFAEPAQAGHLESRWLGGFVIRSSCFVGSAGSFFVHRNLLPWSLGFRERIAQLLGPPRGFRAGAWKTAG